MKRGRGPLILFIIFILMAVMGVVIIFSIKAALEDKPVVRSDSVLRLNLAGAVTEQFPRDAFSREFEGASLQMHDIREALKMAKADERIEGVYLRISTPGLGWAKAESIRRALLNFKESGKFVTAFMSMPDERAYYIALAADEVYIQPHSFAALNGLAVQVPFLKRMFNKLGMRPQVDNIGKYKSAGDILKRESMSPAHREATEAVLNDVYETFVQAVCETRELDRTTVEKALDDGMYRAEQLLELGLVDDVKYETEIIDLLKEKVYGEAAAKDDDKKLHMVYTRRYAKISPAEVGLGDGEKIALIYAIGTIMPGSSGHDPVNGRTLGSRSFNQMLRVAGEDDDIKAVVLRVDSPGGSGQASDEMWAAIEKVREKKPVVISMGDLAASGGYWIAMSCDAIVAEPLTLTGSIGVVSALFDLSGTYDKLGIDWGIVKTNPRADMPTDKRRLTADEWEEFKKLNRDFYQFFVQKVADGRDMTWNEVNEIAQGRVWTGRRAAEIGLVDSLGGLETALAMAKAEAGLEQDVRTQWVVYPQPKGFLDSLFEKIGVRFARHFAAADESWLLWQQLPRETRALVRQLTFLSRVHYGEVLALALFLPEIE